uniref:Ribonuclease H-like domain-containing protein n=1 Tax=Tanacetum cinerariifolium TaxID=118510 RepID=A0A699IWD0_TANCI|nr:ribonuclease H-like domain-containing protein [Tanacetum cinerariifolium]
MRIEQYFLMTDYSLWKVILNGYSRVPIIIVEGVVPPVAPTTAKQKLARKNELKARGTLLMALPDKHQLKFNSHKDAKTLMEAIEKRFGGNTETKKIQKTLLNLPSEWKTHTLIWINKADLEEQSLDDLFNSLKIYEAEVKHSSSIGTTTQNLGFVSSSNIDRTTESVSAAASVFAICAKMHVSSLLNVDSLSNAKTGRNLGANGPTSMGFDMSKVKCYNCHMKGHFARECRSSMDSRRNGSYGWSYQAEEEPANFALMAFSATSSSSNTKASSSLKASSKAYAQLHSQYDKLTDDFCKSQFNVISYQTGLESVKARLLVYKQNESVFEENIKLLNIEVQLRDTALVTLRQKLEKAEQERDDIKLNWPPSSLYDMFQPSGGYHDVPSPTTRTFMPPKPNLVFHTVPIDVETDHSAFTIQLSPTKPAQDLSHTNRPTAPIIEDWVSDSEDEFETKALQIIPSFV